MALVTAIRDGRAEWYDLGSSRAEKLARELWKTRRYELVEARASFTVLFFRRR